MPGLGLRAKALGLLAYGATVQTGITQSDNTALKTLHAFDAAANMVDPDLRRTKSVAEWLINKLASGNYASAAAAMASSG